MIIVLHANWSEGRLHLWAEDAARFAAVAPRPDLADSDADAEDGEIPADSAFAPSAAVALAEPAIAAVPGVHPFAVDLADTDLGELLGGAHAVPPPAAGTLPLRLPAIGGVPLPSTTLARAAGRGPVAPDPQDAGPVLERFEVPARVIDAPHAAAALLALGERLRERADLGPAVDDGSEPLEIVPGGSLEWLTLAARLAKHLMAQQRFVPSLVQSPSGELRGLWQPWMSDEGSAARVARLVEAMPASARAAVDASRHEAWAITEDFLNAAVDAECRRTLFREGFGDSLSGRVAAQDAHVAWLGGLLGREVAVPGTVAGRQDMTRRVRSWLGVLEERGASSAWRLLLRLAEPPLAGLKDDQAPDPDDPTWTLSFHLQSVDQPSLILDAADVWLLTGDSVSVMGRRIEGPQELLLGELGRASRFYPRLEEALEGSEPESLMLGTRKAYEFLREVRPVLTEQGIGVEAPSWWDTPTARLGAKLRLESDEFDPFGSQGAGLTNAAKAQLGLAALVGYRWEIAVGDTTLSLHEFEQLAAKRTPLVRINGRWVEIRPEDVHAAIRFIRDNPGGKIKLGEAMRLAYGSDLKQTGIPVVGLEATGWLAAFLNSESQSKALEQLEPPKSFKGTLRPYQARGVSWMAFQEQLGFGVCLADDMGLGKTIQLLALMAYERERSEELIAAGFDPATLGLAKIPSPADSPFASPLDLPADAETTDLPPGETMPVPDASLPGGVAGEGAKLPMADPAIYPFPAHGVPPTLLLVPMSVVGNWIHETRRFCPHLKVLVHHGIARLQGETFLRQAHASDLIITTYALAHRDRDLLGRARWGRIVLDEAQYIKNPAAKQSQAVRSFDAAHRVALTGTPVENRLTELWSIMDFLNPGYLGSSGGFRNRFAVPIERYHDRARAEQLRGLIRPFVLRRLKSDPTVVADLPEKVETKEYSHLTGEQANMYETCVKRMLTEVDEAEGMQRRGLVLSALIRLKQICDHPSLILKDHEDSVLPSDPTRSGKCIRILEMLDEALAEGDQALVFTQFRQMGRLLDSMIRHRFGKDVLFIHGGSTQPQRQAMIERFQKADGTAPVLILSLRAGGVGLNLTAATHVFHFDRWWNPAVENQATDRAYRIGQTRTVQVHKFVVRGTLEERIDQMIESKTELAENIIGAGETWLSEMNTDQLRDILTLRNDAVDDVE